MNNPTKEELAAQKKEIILKYLNNPRFTGGRDKIFNFIRQDHPNISRRDVAAVLRDDPQVQQHRPINRRVTSRPIIIKDKGLVWGIDLIDFQKVASKNDGYRYILTTIDMLSKYASARPIKNKTQANVTAALLNILDSIPEDWRPRTIVSDRGSEFQAGMQNALALRGIKLIHSQAYSPWTNGSIERLNRTLKTGIFSMMARHPENNHRWVEFLDPLVENINNSVHTATKHRPLELMKNPLAEDEIANIHASMEQKRPKQAEKMHHKYSVGDYVRVALTTESAMRKQIFRKRIMNNYSSEVYQIYSISTPASLGTQPQYLLYNTVTKRKSIKKYWNYQLTPVTADAVEAERDSIPDEDDEPENEPEEEELPVAPIAAPRRTGRNWAPSAAALRNLAH